MWVPRVREALLNRSLLDHLTAWVPRVYVDFLSQTSFREFEFRDIYEGTYRYGNTGANSAELVLDYKDGDHCDVDLSFNSETSGDATFVCMYDGTTTDSWRAIDRP